MVRPPNKQQRIFLPPLAMQKSICDSIENGNFIDAKIFAFSRRSREHGRVDTPKALFVNTHVLAAACSYFRSTFDLSDGVETSLTEEFPPGVDTAFDKEEDCPDGDYDPAEGGPDDTQAPGEAPAQVLQERTIRTYVIKYTAYKTLRAIVWYIYSGEVFFSDGSPEFPSVSVKSIYRFADEHGMDDLKQLAFGEIAASINRLKQSELMEEAFSVFVSRYPELRDLYIRRLRSVLSSEPSAAFRQNLFHYFSGRLPHSRDILTSLLRALMNGPTVSSPRGVGGSCSTIPRVSHPWPDRTKNALRISLGNGIFEDIHVMVPSGPESAEQPVHFARVVDEGFGSSILRLCQPDSTSQHDAKTSLLTWRGIAYFIYANYISFKPPGSQNVELTPAHDPPDALFRGYPCSPREVLYVARKLAACDALVVLATHEIVSKMTRENVVEEMFCSPPPPTKIINRGVKIIQGNRRSTHICSQLQKILEEAASGDSLANAAAFSACFEGLSAEWPSDESD